MESVDENDAPFLAVGWYSGLTASGQKPAFSLPGYPQGIPYKRSCFKSIKKIDPKTGKKQDGAASILLTPPTP
jgi:hypothetical protein